MASWVLVASVGTQQRALSSPELPAVKQLNPISWDSLWRMDCNAVTSLSHVCFSPLPMSINPLNVSCPAIFSWSCVVPSWMNYNAFSVSCRRIPEDASVRCSDCRDVSQKTKGPEVVWSTDHLKMPRFICIWSDLYTFHRYFSPYLSLTKKIIIKMEKHLRTSSKNLCYFAMTILFPLVVHFFLSVAQTGFKQGKAN